MLPTRYPDSICMRALGIERSIIHMCSKLDRNEFVEAKNVTYRQLTLEFLSSLIYEPYVGREIHRGQISFRLFVKSIG